MGTAPGLFHSQTVLGEGPFATIIRTFAGISPFGKTWFVDSVNGSDANLGTASNQAFATLAKAVTSASAGDSIIVAPGFTLTLTAALALSKAGLSIVGLGRGTQKPTITVNGAVDGLNITGANVLLDNFHFAAPETDEATAMINVAAAGCVLRNISGIGSQTGKNFVDCLTLAAGADDLFIENLRLFNTTVAVNSFLSIEAAVARLTMRDVHLFGEVVAGGIIDGATATHIDWKRVNVGVTGTSKAAIVLDNNPTGMIDHGRFSGTITTLANNANYGNALRLFDCLVLEETNASAQGALIPAVDAD
jgi:hypothetical protein